MERVRLATAFQQVRQNMDSARQPRSHPSKATPIEADVIRRLATNRANNALHRPARVFLLASTPASGASQDLYAAARLLFRLNQPDAGFTLAERAASDPALTPDVANNFAYDLLTRSRTTWPALRWAPGWRHRGFGAAPSLPHAETLLCAALRTPDTVAPRPGQDALARLLAVTGSDAWMRRFQLAGSVV